MGRQIAMNVSVYYSDNSRRIHLLFGDFRDTVSNEPGRVNYHPQLFRKLAAKLKAEGKPAPDVEDD
ncbi:MAG TPA: hypothetical protein VGA60_01015 [Kiloniellales bacterium]